MSYLAKYPKSEHAADVHIILARSEKSPHKALEHYEAIIAHPSREELLDESRLAACEIYFMLSKYDRCEKVSEAIIKRKSQSSERAVSFLIKSNILQQEYDCASENLDRYSSLLSPNDAKF
ncbi:MAG TPA: hypothetical protein VF857_03060, partial [Spirochaetota bacterium]